MYTVVDRWLAGGAWTPVRIARTGRRRAAGYGTCDPMSPDVIVLALASAPRPAGIAALYALLSSSPSRRVVVAYLGAGLVFSVAVGVLFVAVFHGAEIDYRGTDIYAAVQVIGGVAALGFAAGVGTGRRQLRARRGDRGDTSAISRRLREPSVMTASVAGVATHLPGLFYVVALNAIVAESRALASGVLQVLVFNGIWFGAAFASVVLFLLRPRAAPRLLARVDGWSRRHARAITALVFAGAGAYLTIRGAIGLAG
jgi:Sap, sulfolipid-1-addressing protein